MSLVTLKIRCRPLKPNHFLIPPNNVSVPVWSNLAIGSEDRVQTRLFHSYMSVVEFGDLKIRSR